jgi:hypothetical protein
MKCARAVVNLTLPPATSARSTRLPCCYGTMGSIFGPVLCRGFCEALGGNWGYPWG